MSPRSDKSKEAILREEQSILERGLELHTSDHLDHHHHSSLRSQWPKVQHITLVGNCSKTNRDSSVCSNDTMWPVLTMGRGRGRWRCEHVDAVSLLSHRGWVKPRSAAGHRPPLTGWWPVEVGQPLPGVLQRELKQEQTRGLDSETATIVSSHQRCQANHQKWLEARLWQQFSTLT